MVSKCKESITNGCPLNHKLLSGTPELLELRTASAPDCRCSRLLEHQANVHLDLHFIGLCHMSRNSISLSGLSPERPLAKLLSDFGTLMTVWECSCQLNSIRAQLLFSNF